MAVTDSDVRHIAGLARLGLADERIPSLVGELNAILGHMAVLERVRTSVTAADGVGSAGTPLRADEGPPLPLAHGLASFAPSIRDGFILVPRLGTHESVDDAG